MKTNEIRKIIAKLRMNSREKLYRMGVNKLNKKRLRSLDKEDNIIKRVSIPNFEKTGFPFIVTYLVETQTKPLAAINSMHANNCYKIYGEDLYFIEAIFSEAKQIEDYDELIKINSTNVFKYYTVNDLKREEFIPK